MGVVTLVVGVGLLFAAAFAVEEVCGDVVHIDKLHACGLDNLPVETPVGLVAALNLAIFPFVAWCERHQDGCAAFLTYIINEFLEVPTEGVNQFVGAFLFQLIDVAGVLRTENLPPVFGLLQFAEVVMPKLYEHEIAWLDAVIDLIPAPLVHKGAA